MNAVETSIIIRTFNEGKHIARLLEGILAQDYKDWEILIVDSGSTDDTLDIVRRYSIKIINVRKEDFSFGYSLNVGCRNAAGEYIVFVSAHTYPANNRWLGNIVRPFEDPKIGMVYGRQIGNDVTKVSEAKDMLHNFGEKSRILVEESFGNNANAAIRKSLWIETPYDEKLPGIEDIDWAHRIQEKSYYIYYRADAVIYHIHDETYRQIYNRFKREAIAHKTIFPDYTYERRKSAIVYTLAVLKDMYFGFSQKKPLKKILTSIPYRYAEYCGCRDGYLHAGSLNQFLRNELYFPGKNRSIVISGENQHHIEEGDIPAIAQNEVLIGVSYVGVCSTDLDILEGKLDYYKSGWASYPIIPGHEFSGIIAAAGQGVHGLNAGDKVVGECILGCGDCEHCRQNQPISCKERKEVGVLNFNGAYSRYLKIPARFVHKLPDDAVLEKACLIEPLAVSIRGVNKLLRGEGDRPGKVAVLGYGTIGNLCAQLMSSQGHKVTAFDHNPLRIKGIKKGNISGRTEITGLNDFDYIIEATGQLDVLEKVLSESATGAKILLLGLPYGSVEFNFENLVAFDKAVVGSVGSTKSDFTQAIAKYAELDMESLIQNIFPLEDYEAAWIQHKSGQVAKAILRMNGV